MRLNRLYGHKIEHILSLYLQLKYIKRFYLVLLVFARSNVKVIFRKTTQNYYLYELGVLINIKSQLL